jgi:hypothetical protein
MSDRLIVVRPPQPYPCDWKKGCPDYEPIKHGIACVHWHIFDGCKIKRALNMKVRIERNE